MVELVFPVYAHILLCLLTKEGEKQTFIPVGLSDSRILSKFPCVAKESSSEERSCEQGEIQRAAIFMTMDFDPRQMPPVRPRLCG